MYKTMVSSTTTAPRERGGGLARRLLLAVLALVAVLPIAALGAQSAHAGTYTERVCAPGSGSGETVYAFTGGWYRHSDGCSTGGPLSVSLYPNRWYGAHEGSRYTYTAPSGTKIVALSTNRVKTAGPARDSGDASSYLRDSNGRVLDGCTTRTGCHGAIGNVAFDLSSNPASSFTFGVECWGPSWCPPGNTTYAISNMKITLDDNQAPVLAGQPTGPAMSDEVLHGDEVLNFSASDIGGGLYRTRMLVDGTPTDAQILDANRGKCQPAIAGGDPYTFNSAVPCKLTATGSYTMHTATLPDGEHRLGVEIEDAAGNKTILLDRTVKTDNNPPVVSTTLTGDPHVGQILTCHPTVDGQQPVLTYQWLRLDAAGANGSVIPGATNVTYALTAADEQHKIECRVTATDRGGSASADSLPTAVVAKAPTDTHSNPPPDNGNGATPTAKIAARWTRVNKGKGTSVGTVVYGYQPTIQGVVTNEKGQPVVGATLDVVIKPAAAGRPAIVKTGVITRAGGRFTYKCGSDADSRTITLRYRPSLKSPKVGGERTLRLRVKASVRLSMAHGSASVASGRPRLRFVGQVRGPKMKGQLVEIRVHRPGGGWMVTGAPVRVNRHGQFHMSFRFAARVPRGVFFRFKAVSRQNRGYGFLTGSSKPVKVWVH